MHGLMDFDISQKRTKEGKLSLRVTNSCMLVLDEDCLQNAIAVGCICEADESMNFIQLEIIFGSQLQGELKR